VDGTALGAVTADDGSWDIEGIPDGAWPLTLTSGTRVEHVPSALALPGGDGFLLDGDLYPIGEIELQNGPRLAQSVFDTGTLTADGHLLVTDGSDLVSAPLDGGPILRIAANVRWIQVAPSAPAGVRSWVAVVHTDGTVSAVPAEGGPTIPIGAGAFSQLQFDPSGTVIVARMGDGQLWYAALELGDVRAVARGSWGSNLGQHLSFFDSATTELGTIEYATGNVAYLGAVNVSTIQSLLGGSRILVQERGPLNYQGAVLVGPPGGPLALVAPASGTLFNQIASSSSDHRWVVISTVNIGVGNGFILVSVEGCTVSLSAPTGSFLLFSPDGTQLVFRAAVGGEFRLGRSADGTSLPLPPGSSPGLFSGDGALLAFRAGTHLDVIETTGGAQVAATSDADGYLEPVAFSPDSSALLTRGVDLRSLSLTTSAVTVLSSTYVQFTETVYPDQDRVVFKSADGLVSAPLSGAPVTLLAPPGVYNGSQQLLLPSGAVLYQSAAGMSFVPIDGGTVQDLGAGTTNTSVSTDGLAIAHLATDGTLRSAALPDGAPSIVGTGFFAFREVEGGIVAFQTTDNTIWIAPPTGPATSTGVQSWSTTPAAGGWVLIRDPSLRLFTAKVPTGETSLIATGVGGPSQYGYSVRGGQVLVDAAGVLDSALVSGGPLVPLVRLGPDGPSPGGTFWWVDDHHGLARRTSAPPPYRFQNGTYLVTVP
jgi:hypothetical protein